MDSSQLNLAQIRTDYNLTSLDEKEVGKDPISFFEQWMLQAEHAQITEVNAMTLATVDDLRIPHARIVLLKGIEDGGFIFFTNYESHKGQQILKNNKVALIFFWKELQRQVRIEGSVEKVSESYSDIYFHSRPKGSQFGACASPQSQVIESRVILEDKMAAIEKEYKDKEIPRPVNWGGFIVKPQLIEFWQGRRSRLHDRIVCEKKEGNSWNIYRLAP